MGCVTALDSASLTRPIEDQNEMDMVDIAEEVIDLETTNSTAGVEAEEKETSPQAEPTTTCAHVEQPEKKETTKGKQAAKERKHGGPPTEKERNLAMAMKHIAEEKKQAEMKGKVYLWLAEKIPEICNQAISMAKGDADVRMLAGHVSAEFRAAFQKLQHRGHAPNPGQTEKKRQSPETGKATKPKGTTAQKQEAPSGKRTYATVAKQATGGTKQPVAQKKTTIKSPGKEGEQMSESSFGDRPKAKNRRQTITGLEDFYVLSEEGPVPIRTEQWFSEQIAKQTGGQVKAIKWQMETEKYKDATIRFAIVLLEGQPLPTSMKFVGSSNMATIKSGV
ncbi:hypothetical protein CFO_g5536 [Ceratocystis platani]|uniref:Uncharacterized protein n=1 Tax=Ceratocystis fimbriata f. sp. platani TaxID=88771 RepID=A0A0F8D7K5_CERFI|nr:hypothetical protein CFO_g5536 [Ceratocystis platani]